MSAWASFVQSQHVDGAGDKLRSQSNGPSIKEGPKGDGSIYIYI